MKELEGKKAPAFRLASSDGQEHEGPAVGLALMSGYEDGRGDDRVWSS